MHVNKKNKTNRNKFIIRHSNDAYGAIVDYLENHGFQDVSVVESSRSIKSNWSHLSDLLHDAYFLVTHIKQFNQADILFSIGYTTIPLKILMKMGFIKCRRLFWFGFFLHSPRAFRLFRILSRLLSVDEERYVVFSKWEQILYSKSLGIPASKLLYMPWGSWGEAEGQVTPDATIRGDYYFSGGASNRDYLSLVEVFRGRPDELVIVCSPSKNSELFSVAIPPNITVYTDIDSKKFNELVRAAKACILILKHNTGASGQDVLLRYMRQAKVIIASNTAVVREYIENHESGILIEEPLKELPGVMNRLDGEPELGMLGNAARSQFLGKFSRQAVSAALEDITNS